MSVSHVNCLRYRFCTCTEKCLIFTYMYDLILETAHVALKNLNGQFHICGCYAAILYMIYTKFGIQEDVF